MSATYIVIAMKNGCELEICEAYAGAKAALCRAFNLSKFRSFANKEQQIPVPNGIHADDGSIRWVFLSTDRAYVGVHFQHIMINQSYFEPIKSAIYPAPSPLPTINLNEAVIDPVVTFDAPYEETLPAGWFCSNNKPATMKDLWETPDQIKSLYQLSNPQKWAIVKARILKRPNYHLDIPSFGIFNQARALLEINKESDAGEEVVENEIQWLEELRIDRYQNLTDENI